MLIYKGLCVLWGCVDCVECVCWVAIYLCVHCELLSDIVKCMEAVYWLDHTIGRVVYVELPISMLSAISQALNATDFCTQDEVVGLL